jgi:glycosyltransferase involved in cell wall biosynthesis
MIYNRIRIEISLMLRNSNLLKKLFAWILGLNITRKSVGSNDIKQKCSDLHNSRRSEPRSQIPHHVTVILPTFNHGVYLDEAIKSVLSQKGVNLRLIVVNDGSTDNTEEVLENYHSLPNVRILHQDNQGLPNAINAGLRLAESEFITWTSADNKHLPGALLLLANALFENSDLALVYADYQIVDEFGSPSLNSSYRVFDQDRFETSRIRNCRVGTLFDYMPDNFVGPLFMFRREHSDLVGAFSNLIGVEDYDYWLRLNSVGEVKHVYSQEALYLYRIHSNTLSKKSRELKTRKKLRTVVSKYW